MKRQFLMSLKKHETLIGSPYETLPTKIKSGTDVVSFSSKDSKRKIQFMDEIAASHQKDWLHSQDDEETIEVAENRNIV